MHDRCCGQRGKPHRNGPKEEEEAEGVRETCMPILYIPSNYIDIIVGMNGWCQRTFAINSVARDSS